MQVDAPFFFSNCYPPITFKGNQLEPRSILFVIQTLLLFHHLSSGSKGEHEAVIPADHRATIQPLSQTGQIQEAVVLVVFLPQRVVGEKEVPYAWLEHTIWV